jgi:roadblock/LC7 domain-containing protein
LAYLGWVGDKRCVVVDGVEGKLYDKVNSYRIIFSPDSKHVAYPAKMDNKSFVVVDRVEGKHYDDIDQSSLTFSPNGKQIVYAAKTKGKWFVVVKALSGVVVNEVEGKQYDNLGGLVPIHNINFNPDSNHMAYSVRIGADPYVNETKLGGAPRRYGSGYEEFVVVDGVEASGKYSSIMGPWFDYRNKIQFRAIRGNQYYFVEGDLT